MFQLQLSEPLPIGIGVADDNCHFLAVVHQLLHQLTGESSAQIEKLGTQFIFIDEQFTAAVETAVKYVSNTGHGL